jgi:hypothetical protein
MLGPYLDLATSTSFQIFSNSSCLSTFRRNALSPSSGSKSKLRKQQFPCVLARPIEIPATSTKLHGVTSRNVLVFLGKWSVRDPKRCNSDRARPNGAAVKLCFPLLVLKLGRGREEACSGGGSDVTWVGEPKYGAGREGAGLKAVPYGMYTRLCLQRILRHSRLCHQTVQHLSAGLQLEFSFTQSSGVKF